jgi:exodeoxyribonuclease VII large subunit
VSKVRYLTVTALTRYIKKKFDVDPHMQQVFLKGEISNFKLHSRGHMYFTVKDETARIQAVMFATNNRSLTFKPENGMKVLLTGEISVFEVNGNYQMYVSDMQPDGIGSLYLAYEELKKRLDQEGMFSSINKKPIPSFPKKIGVITSPTGAAVRDILSTIKRRYPIGQVLIIPTLVQGEYAAPSIVKSIDKANERDDLDVLIVGRGGGSIEELWAFNEETVARAIFHSKIPIISAVGHETDYTIADFVSDLRAPTPTGAAELAVPHISELTERILQRKMRLIRAAKEKMNFESSRLSNMKKSYAFRYPKQLYKQKEQQLDRVMEDLEKSMYRNIEQRKALVIKLESRFTKFQPERQITILSERYKRASKQLEKEIHALVQKKELSFHSIISKLEALSPLRIMDRGYSIAYYDNENSILKSVKDVNPGDAVKVQLKDGMIDCQVTGPIGGEK